MKMFHKVAGTVFAITALGHLARVLFGWDVVIGTYSIPSWLSLVGAVIAGFLSYTAFKLGGVLK
ncbi:MAG TPA: hypothetical protein VES68_02015 [Candidatus Sulfotelmatobacter sp.]|nr:hypothetical protein [Candidatus Sulfotelmatobacter sp.]